MNNHEERLDLQMTTLNTEELLQAIGGFGLPPERDPLIKQMNEDMRKVTYSSLTAQSAASSNLGRNPTSGYSFETQPAPAQGPGFFTGFWQGLWGGAGSLIR
jgi:hypothetical protein